MENLDMVRTVDLNLLKKIDGLLSDYRKLLLELPDKKNEHEQVIQCITELRVVEIYTP